MTQDIDFSRIHRVLVTKLRFHGDVILASPVLTALIQAHPHLTIHALVYRESVTLLDAHPAVERVHYIEKSGRHVGKELRLLERLRRSKYDLLIHLTESWRGPVIRRWAGIPLAVAARYPVRRGKPWARQFTHLYNVPAVARHRAETHLDALRALGMKVAADGWRLSLYPGEAAVHSAAAKLRAHGLDDTGYSLIHPPSRFDAKEWPADRMASLAARLPGRVVLTGSPDERDVALVKQICQASGRTDLVNLAGRLSLPELAACIQRAKLFVGVDSAPMHMAAAVGTPTVALFGPTDHRVWGPWQVPHEIVRAGFSCQPCNQRGCGGTGRSDCLQELAVSSVYRACLRLLNAQAQPVQWVAGQEGTSPSSGCVP